MGWVNFIRKKAKEANLEIAASIVDYENIDLPPGSLTHFTYPQNIESIFKDKALKAPCHGNGKGFSHYQVRDGDMTISLSLFLKYPESCRLPNPNKYFFRKCEMDLTKYLKFDENYSGGNRDCYAYFKRFFRPKVFFLFDRRLNQLIASENEEIPALDECKLGTDLETEAALKGINAVRVYENLRLGKASKEEVEEVNKEYIPCVGLRAVKIKEGQLVPIDVPIELVEKILIDKSEEEFLLGLEKKYGIKEALDPSKEEISRIVNESFKNDIFLYREPRSDIEKKIIEKDLLGVNSENIVRRIMEKKKERHGLNLVEVLQEIEKVKFLRKHYDQYIDEVIRKNWFHNSYKFEYFDFLLGEIHYEWLNDIEKENK